MQIDVYPLSTAEALDVMAKKARKAGHIQYFTALDMAAKLIREMAKDIERQK